MRRKSVRLSVRLRSKCAVMTHISHFVTASCSCSSTRTNFTYCTLHSMLVRIDLEPSDTNRPIAEGSFSRQSTATPTYGFRKIAHGLCWRYAYALCRVLFYCKGARITHLHLCCIPPTSISRWQIPQTATKQRSKLREFVTLSQTNFMHCHVVTWPQSKCQQTLSILREQKQASFHAKKKTNFFIHAKC